MVRLRFKRIGRPHAYYLQLVAAVKRSSRDGKPIEVLGTFNPHDMAKPHLFKQDRVKHWLSVGAQPTDVVVQTIKKLGVWKDIKPTAKSSSK